jgi:transitional endoplasmic reticulum ATPase
MSESINLKVGELTNREEFGKGIARLATSFMQKLGLKEGNYVEIEGEKKTYAIAVRSYPSDIGLDVIRMDGITRKNASTGIGEMASAKKADIKEAQRVTLAPAQEGMMIHVDPDYMKQNLFKRPFAKGDVVVPNPVAKRRQADIFDDEFPEFFKSMLAPFGEIRLDNLFGGMKFIVVDISPKEGGYVGERTELDVLSKAVEIKEEQQLSEVTYDDLGGLKDEIVAVREVIELPMRHPELFQRLGIKPPKGVLMHGPPGTGKTLLAKAVANESGANFYSIAGPEIMSKYYGQSEENLRKIFDDAEKNAPAIIFIDEIDAIAPKREEVTGEVERRVVSQLLTMMDGLKARGQVIVIGATNRPDSLDPALRRPGRFDREIEIGVPNKEGRYEILQIHARNMPLAEDVDLKQISEKTYGFVGADLESLCKEAAMRTLRRVLPDISSLKNNDKLPKETMEKLMVTQADFADAMQKVEPSAMREVLVEVPNVHWSDIGGLENVKQQLVEVVEWPLKYPKKFEDMNIKAPKGVVMYGPPGTGKTLLAKAVANESGANFISIRGPELLSKYVGESEKKLREIFKKAKQSAPSIIFFDEIDAMTRSRGGEGMGRTDVIDSIVSQLLTEMSGIEDLKGVVIIAATNRPDLIDTSLMRPGRFDRRILVPTPDKEGRLQILKIQTKGVPIDKDVTLEDIAEKTEGYSGADLEGLVREAAMLTLRESIIGNKEPKKVTKKQFDKVMSGIRPSVPKKLSKWYEDFEKAVLTPDEEKKKVLEPEYAR